MHFRHSSARRSPRLCARLVLAASLGMLIAPYGGAVTDDVSTEPPADATTATPQHPGSVTDTDGNVGAPRAADAADPAEAGRVASEAAAAPEGTTVAAPGATESAGTEAATIEADEPVDAASVPDQGAAPAAGSTPGSEPASAPLPASGPAAPETIGTALGSETSELDRVEVQIEAREYDAARQWLESHVTALEHSSQRYDPALVRPLTLLGDANMGKGKYAEALLHYQRATHLARVNAGLKSLDQVPIVYREAAAYKALGQYEAANDREEYAYQIVASHADPNDVALLPALYRLANWYLKTGNTFAARELYDRALSTLEATGQGNTAAAIPALQGRAATYRLERFPVSYGASQQVTAVMDADGEPGLPMTVNNFPAGEEALQRIVRIRQQMTDSDPMALVAAVLDLADWYTLFDKPVRADPLYAHAFELLGQVPEADRVSLFAEPHLLYMPEPGTPRNRGSDVAGEIRTGYVEVAYSVTANGYVRDLETVASAPEGLMDIRVRRSLRVARYRPALADGVPIASAHVTYRYEFEYRAEPEEDPGDKPDAASDAPTPEVVKQ